MNNLNNIGYWVFDLDNTLYPAGNNLFSQVDTRMGDYISQKLNLSADTAKLVQKKYFHLYGTTLRGLMIEHDIVPQDFLDYVHDINFDVLDINHSLNSSLKKLRGKKYIYTNASRKYAVKVVAKLGLEGVFDDIFDIISADFLPKPDPKSYHKMARHMGIDTKKSVMVEDIARNLAPAYDLGMKTVWIPTEHAWSKDNMSEDHIDYTVPDLAVWLKNLVKD